MMKFQRGGWLPNVGSRAPRASLRIPGLHRGLSSQPFGGLAPVTPGDAGSCASADPPTLPGDRCTTCFVRVNPKAKLEDHYGKLDVAPDADEVDLLDVLVNNGKREWMFPDCSFLMLNISSSTSENNICKFDVNKSDVMFQFWLFLNGHPDHPGQHSAGLSQARALDASGQAQG